MKSPRILCIERDLSVLDSRCGVLKHNGYDAYAASLKISELVLAGQSFDLVILSAGLTDPEKLQVAQAAGSTKTMVLDGLTMPSTLLTEVAARLPRHKQRIA
jgi:DNA-binding response OmpR family regulator